MSEKRSLKEMTLQELWQLFPIKLVPYNRKWKNWAKEEKEKLQNLLAIFSHRIHIHHIGSTAIPGIYAKPIVDILIEVDYLHDWNNIKEILESEGYICMSISSSRMSFNKGYTPDGYAERVFHIHIHRSGDNDEVVFRDFLIRNPCIAKEYEQLKLSLLPRFTHDRDGYTEAKTEFISKIMKGIHEGEEK